MISVVSVVEGQLAVGVGLTEALNEETEARKLASSESLFLDSLTTTPVAAARPIAAAPIAIRATMSAMINGENRRDFSAFPVAA